MNFEYIESYLAVCKYKSISEAAKSLYISQPTLTNRLKKLEEYLDVTLFERSWKGIKLTKKGQDFLPHALHLMNKLDEFKILSSNPKNINYNHTCYEADSFTIGMNDYLVDFTKSILRYLKDKFPNLNINITTGSTKELMTKYRYGLLDYIVYYCLDSQLPNTTELGRDKLVLILNDTDYSFVKDNIQLIKLINKPIFVNENPAQVQFSPLFKTIKERFELPNIVLIENEKLIATLIQAGKGHAIFPESIYHFNYKDDYLQTVTIEDPSLDVPIFSSYKDKEELASIIAPLLDNVIVSQIK